MLSPEEQAEEARKMVGVGGNDDGDGNGVWPNSPVGYAAATAPWLGTRAVALARCTRHCPAPSTTPAQLGRGGGRAHRQPP
ncbi:hypothetical protein GUJ93_ZPchr0004g39722 [Zizania palustris]|uniref:Uncharacterized protein n=1 Tax=Zizania palustris TaxID=103762 RepID=A0A8J5VFY2_ZIZPA|nr:hypothetical protein GUJ93_ZPchr0004g39722 [Zizania palustris]